MNPFLVFASSLIMVLAFAGAALADPPDPPSDPAPETPNLVGIGITFTIGTLDPDATLGQDVVVPLATNETPGAGLELQEVRRGLGGTPTPPGPGAPTPPPPGF